jgi:hypothetical protein
MWFSRFLLRFFLDFSFLQEYGSHAISQCICVNIKLLGEIRLT